MSENLGFVLASTLKNTPTYLNCHVSIKVDASVATHLGTATGKFYNDQNENVEDDEDEDDEVGDHQASEDEVRRYYDKQYEDNLHQRNQSNVIAAPPVKPRTKRSVETGLSFEWLRNDVKVITLSLGDNKIVNLDGFTLFTNGTLKFQASNITTGEYRCKVKYTEKRARSFVIGPMISRVTVVEVASELE